MAEQEIPKVDLEISQSESDESLDRLSDKNLIFIDVSIKGFKLKALIDSGSPITIMHEYVFSALALPLEAYPGPQIITIDNKHLTVIGQTEIEIKPRDLNLSVMLKVIIAKNLCFDLILGNNFNLKTSMTLNFDEKRKPIDFPHLWKKGSDSDEEVQETEPNNSPKMNKTNISPQNEIPAGIENLFITECETSDDPAGESGIVNLEDTLLYVTDDENF